MPVITVEGPKINDTDRKRKLVASITEAAHEAYGLPRSVYVVYIKENNPDNVAVGGELLCDRDKK
jgi:4-oxalocrotonate tautomerase